jgi:hypothetical protein
MPERRASQPRGHVEQRSANSGGGLLGTVLTLVGIPVGWFISVVALMIVLTHLISPDAPISLISSLGPQTTFYVSIAVIVVVGFVILVKPATIFFGWLLMGILVAVAATFVVGWTTLLLIFEVLTVVYLIPAYWSKLIEDAPDGFLAALALKRKLR